MSTLLLVRHGLTAMTGPVLAGRTPSVHLDERGVKQAAAVAERIAAVPLTAIVTSPLDRCLETAGAIRDAQLARPRKPGSPDLQWHVDPRIIECDYGDWTARPFKELMKEPMWKIVQGQPSAASFPGGEALTDMWARATGAIRDWNNKLGDDAVWVACAHGDIIKAIVADALGLHLDQYQRIVPDPCSVSVIRYTEARPYVIRVNDTGGDLAGFAPQKKRRSRTKAADATIGGGTGHGSV